MVTFGDKSYDKSVYRNSCSNYDKKVEDKEEALNNCIGFIYGTVFEIALTDNDDLQNVC